MCIRDSYDIMTQDKAENRKFHLDALCFGDLVAIQDHDNHHGPHYLKGAISIGVVVHSDSFTSGHGPCLLYTSVLLLFYIDFPHNSYTF